MNARTRGWRSSALFLSALLFCAVFRGVLTVGQVISRVDFEIQPSIVQDVADPGDDVIWLSNTFTLADLNDDGPADLVAINQLGATLFVRLSRGDGTFDDGLELLVVDIDESELEPTSVAVGDVGSPFASEVDGEPDGNQDIVVGTVDGAIVIFVGDGEGNFGLRQEDLYIQLTEVIDVELADFDGDGRLDIAALDSFDEAVVMVNQAGAFDPDTDSFFTGGDEGTADQIGSGDFDGDGDVDLVVLNRRNRTLSLLLGHGDGAFDEPRFLSTLADSAETNQEPRALAVADLDADEVDDVAIINYGLFSDLQLLVRYGPGLSVGRSFPAPFQATSLALDDFDGNGFLDALIASEGGVTGTVFLPDDGGAGGFSGFGGFEIRGLSSGAAIAADDFAGDSLPDFVQLRSSASEFQVAVNVSNQPTPTMTATASPVPSFTESPTPTEAPTATPTPMATSSVTATQPATPTVTQTVTGTATASPSPTPTMTSAPTPSSFEEDDGCTLVVPESGRPSGGAAALLLLVGLVLSWTRRKFR